MPTPSTPGVCGGVREGFGGVVGSGCESADDAVDGCCDDVDF